MFQGEKLKEQKSYFEWRWRNNKKLSPQQIFKFECFLRVATTKKNEEEEFSLSSLMVKRIEAAFGGEKKFHSLHNLRLFLSEMFSVFFLPAPCVLPRAPLCEHNEAKVSFEK